MNTLVRTHLVKIGNSRGIRIPKWLIEQVGLAGQVEVEAQAGQLVIRPAESARQGWDAQFESMAQAGDDLLLDADSVALTDWENAEWEW